VVMTENRHEFNDIRAIADSMDADFRFDTAIFPRLGGDITPLSYRIDPADAVHLEMNDKKFFTAWSEYSRRMKEAPVPESLYQCGAGVTNFHIDADGNLHPCIMPTGIQFPLSQKGDFSRGWEEMKCRMNDLEISGDVAVCRQCEKRFVCAYCPAFFAMETGKSGNRSDFLCAQAHYRFETLRKKEGRLP